MPPSYQAEIDDLNKMIAAISTMQPQMDLLLANLLGQQNGLEAAKAIATQNSAATQAKYDAAKLRLDAFIANAGGDSRNWTDEQRAEYNRIAGEMNALNNQKKAYSYDASKIDKLIFMVKARIQSIEQ